MGTESKRTCGSCTACCVAYEVPQIPKVQNELCPHLKGEGCGIHWRRPGVCREFRCLWLQGFGEDADQPNRSHRILSFYEDRSGTFGVLQVACMGSYRPAEDEIRILLRKFMETQGYPSASASVTYADATSFSVRSDA